MQQRNGKKRQADFRNYNDDTEQNPAKKAKLDEVKATYEKGQQTQTLAHVESRKKEYKQTDGYTDRNGNKVRMSVKDILKLLESICDSSDPDTSEAQSLHSLQTAESLKEHLDPNDLTKIKNIPVKDIFTQERWNQLPNAYKTKFKNATLASLYSHITDWSWLPLIGLLHDMGKVLAHKRMGGLKQHEVVGDTFPVGAPFAPANVYYKDRFFEKNPDLDFSKSKSTGNRFGIYVKHCGFDEVEMSWGHDEYGAWLLENNINHFPAEAFYLIKYHSFYPWHKGGAYSELANDKDYMTLPLLIFFQKSDLYSKRDTPYTKQELKEKKEYYEQLTEKYIPCREPTPYNLRPGKMLL